MAPWFAAPVALANREGGPHAGLTAFLPEPTAFMDAIFKIAGSSVTASQLAGGPYDPRLQHGGAPTALIAHLAETIDRTPGMAVSRLTVDLMRPVPVGGLTFDLEVVRTGRRTRSCLVRLFAGEAEVVRGSVLKVATSLDPEQLAPLAIEGLDVPGPEAGALPDDLFGETNRLLEAFTPRVVCGGFQRPGRRAVWFRLDRPMVQDCDLTPLVRTAAAADFANSASSHLDFAAWTFPNADLNLHLMRMPVGHWILVDGETWIGPAGQGLAFARLADQTGYIGRVTQTVVLAPKAGRRPHS
jgi:Thioesterase-like superfamily